MAVNVLVVDDSSTMRHMVMRALELSGAPLGQVLEAANGREALDALAANWIDLVLTDINMPVMDGVEMLRAMRDSGLLATMPVVVISTEANDQRIHELRDMGVGAYLRKPFRPELLRATLEELLGYHHEG
jgi:two-component system chemotaxis response regulator CheY